MNTTRDVGDVFSHYVSADFVIVAMLACGCISITAGYKLMDYLLKKKALENTEERIRQKAIQEYEKSFVDELAALENITLKEDRLNELASLKCESETPFGKVIMTYDVYANSFMYYTDSRNVPYKTLDAVARRFAVEHNCKSICVNYKEEWNKAKAAAKAKQEEDIARANEEKTNAVNKTEKETEDKTRDVFAKFKSYNTVNKNDLLSNDDGKQTKKKGRESIKRRKYRPVVDKTNRFTNKGRLSEYDDKRASKTNTNVKVLSFAEFKKQELEKSKKIN